MNRVLIVDDNDQNRYFLQALMQGSGFGVEEARHGAEALVKARQTPPQLIISDLLMPVMDGYTLLRHWKTDEQLKNIPFVVYTSTYTAAQDERLAMDLGADVFIIKPTEPEPFMERIHEVLVRQKKGKLPQVKSPSGNGEDTLQQYSAVLLRKLESKMLQLEEKNRALELNIIERKRVEEALREQKDLLNAILENEPECVKLVSPDGKLLQMNQAGLNMLEVGSLEELLQFKLLDFILPDSRVAFLDLFNSVFVGGSGILEFQIQGHRGTQRWLEPMPFRCVTSMGRSRLCWV
jgi:CheY-like chemotaxis protein